MLFVYICTLGFININEHENQEKQLKTIIAIFRWKKILFFLYTKQVRSIQH